MRRKLILLPAFLSMLAAAPGFASEGSQPIKPAVSSTEAQAQVQVIAGARAIEEEGKAQIEGKHICFPVAIADPGGWRIKCMGSRRRWPHVHR